MKTSASSGATLRAVSSATLRPLPRTVTLVTLRALPQPSRAIGITGRLYRSWMRAWLRYRLDTCTRCLHTIAAQRENDFHAERMLHREMSATRSRLQSL